MILELFYFNMGPWKTITNFLIGRILVPREEVPRLSGKSNQSYSSPNLSATAVGRSDLATVANCQNWMDTDRTFYH